MAVHCFELRSHDRHDFSVFPVRRDSPVLVRDSKPAKCYGYEDYRADALIVMFNACKKFVDRAFMVVVFRD